ALSADNDIIFEGACFAVTGALLYFAANGLPGRRRGREMRTVDALLIGAGQAVSQAAGISRLGVAISASMLLGFEKRYAIVFSYIIGLPTAFAMLIWDFKAVLKGGINIPLPILLAGFFTSLIFGILAISFVKWLVIKDKLHWISYYSLLLGFLTVIIGVFEKLQGAPIKHFITAFF
ncbi:MAG: undecaprenyl-diphosphate phosphatase, partial [Oscillospiraceae bacterium]